MVEVIGDVMANVASMYRHDPGRRRHHHIHHRRLGLERLEPRLLLATGFTDIHAGLLGTMFSSVDWGDYDNDNDLDILLTGGADGARISKVYQNQGNDSFRDISADLIGVVFGSAAWGDYDHDGDLDILITGLTDDGSVSKVYQNKGSGSFSDISASLIGLNSGSVAWGDYDNDGDLDILLTGNRNGYPANVAAKIYQNRGDGSFSDISADLPGVYVSSVAWGDYDDDNDLDILLTGRPGPQMQAVSRIYQNQGNGNFSDISAGLTGVEFSSVAWGDYDNDSDLDILLTGYGTYTKNIISKVYENQVSGTFHDVSAGVTGVWQGSSAWGDYDNDGDLDILLTGLRSNGRVSQVYQNSGSGSFSDISAGLTAVGFSSVAWGDYDNDADLDILLAGEDGSENRLSKVYKNEELDFGDAPTSYFTRMNSGARHLALGPMLGSLRDTETNGLPSAASDGDDSDGMDDEDGVALPASVVSGLSSTATVTASAAAKLDAWVDFDRNGTFDAGEQIAASLPVVGGANLVTFTVPAGAVAGQSYARFRLSTAGGLGPKGAAPDGEVEDYALQIMSPPPGSASLIDDPLNPGANVLLVMGTAQDDTLKIDLKKGQLQVTLKKQLLGKFDAAQIGRIVAFGLEGNDTISVGKKVLAPIELQGDEGDDTLTAGGGASVLVGGADNDTLKAGAAAAVLIGGLGADTLKGGKQTDLLIGGRTSYDARDEALQAILAEWASDRSYQERTNRLELGDGVPKLDETTVFNDGAADSLDGGKGLDWFIAGLEDSLKKLEPGERLDRT